MTDYINSIAHNIQNERKQSDATRDKNLTIIKQILKHIQKEDITDFREIVKYKDSIILFLDNQLTFNTSATKYYALLTYLKYFENIDEIKPFLKKISKICDELTIKKKKINDEQIKTEKEKKKWDSSDWDILIEKLNNFNIHENISVAEYTNYVATCLFVFQEPRRAADYVMRVVDEYDEDDDENQYIKSGLFCFKKYKTVDSYGVQTFPVNKKLKQIIEKYHYHIHHFQSVRVNYLLMISDRTPVDDPKLVSTKVRTFLEKITNKPMSINTLRHMYIENYFKLNPNPSIAERKKLSQKMAHDFTTQMSYVKIDNPIQESPDDDAPKTSIDILNDLYNEIGPSGMDKLYRAVKERNLNITQKQVREFIKNKKN